MTNHPSDVLIQAFSLGTAEPGDVQVVETHLESCPACCTRVEQAVSDPFLSQLRRVGGEVSATDATGGGRGVVSLGDAPAGPCAVTDTVGYDGHTPAQDGYLPVAGESPLTIGVYRVEAELGRGGMGVVYRARDTRLGRSVALKVMLPQFAAHPGAAERFLREAQAAAQIAHDHVVTVYEADARDGVPYIAMQLLQGCPLDQYVKQHGAPGLEQVLRIARETAAGLGAAHRLGLVHRDVKPANLWLEAPDGRVKLLDFGLARPVETKVEVTRSGAVLGTPAYMSPEQARGDKVDHRTDLFSLGAILYRLCTGRLPFEGPTTMAVLTALATQEPPPVRELNPAVPEPLAALIHQLLAKQAADRPASADEVVQRVRAIVEDTPAAPASAALLVRRPPGRRWPWVVAACAGALAAIAGIVILIKNKDGTETRIELPEGVGVVVKDTNGKPLAVVGPESKPVPAPADSDRKAALWALSLGGMVRVNGDVRPIREKAELPPGQLTLDYVVLQDRPVTDAGLAHLRGLGSLQHLNLRGTNVTDAAMPTLAGLADLRWLDLTCLPVTDVGLQAILPLKRLERLYLGNTRVTEAGVKQLAGFPELQVLHLVSLPVSDAAVTEVAGLKNLWDLSLEKTAVTDLGLADLHTLKRLTLVNVRETRVTSEGLAGLRFALPRCRIEHDPQLHLPDRDLQLAEWALAQGGVVKINGEPRDYWSRAELPDAGFVLTSVALSHRPAQDADLARLKGFDKLLELWLYNTEITDAGMVHVKALKSLVVLDLGRTRVGDAGLAQLDGLDRLIHLGLPDTAVTDAGVAHLKNMKNLSRLWLFNTGLTDAGLAELQGLGRLRELHVQGTKVTAKGVAEFHDAVPRCRIEYDGGIIEATAGNR